MLYTRPSLEYNTVLAESRQLLLKVYLVRFERLAQYSLCQYEFRRISQSRAFSSG